MKKWWFKESPGLWVDLYELAMAQAYFKKKLDREAFFEVTIRALPDNWGYLLMAGLAELEAFLKEYHFDQPDLDYLESTGYFEADFLDYLARLKLDVNIRALPEGTLFFPNEPILESGGPLIQTQLLETYILNIIGFSIIETTLASRIVQATGGIPVVDFGMRRAQGPVSSLRAARAGQLAGFTATSNVYAARLLDFKPSGTMAHSFVEIHESEMQGYENFADIYGEKAILLVDTYDTKEGIKMAADLTRRFYEKKGIKLGGIRIDSGDMIALSKFAREHFKKSGVDFLKIFISSGLDEYKIAQMLKDGLQADGFGVGTSFTVSRNAPALDIVYKIIQYDNRGVYKKSPEKGTLPGRKTILRQTGNAQCTGDRVIPFDPRQQGDLLQPFTAAEPTETIQHRIRDQLRRLPENYKSLQKPPPYPVQFDLDTKP
jgi:nicotinate phosphoribosyltransferase